METSEQRVPDAVVELRGGIAPDLVDYARLKMATVLGHTGRAVLRARVRVLRHHDPPGTGPSRPAPTSTWTADRCESTSRPRAPARQWTCSSSGSTSVWNGWHTRARRVRRDTPPGPAARRDREIVRHRSLTARCCSVQDAVAEMDDLGFEFHMFTDIVSGQDAVVYRAGPTGLRLALADGDTTGPHGVDVTVSTRAAPVLDTDAAVERLELTGWPFVFYIDAGHGRAALPHHRHDGGYGLVDPPR